MVRPVILVLAIVFAHGLALEGEEAFDDLVPDMIAQLPPGINTDLQWGDEDIQIIPSGDLEAGQIQVEDGQLPDIKFPLPPGINTGLQWDDENPVHMVPREELEDGDSTSAPVEVGTGAPVEVGTDAPVEVGTGAPVGEEEEVDTAAPVEVEGEDPTNTEAPVEEEEEAETEAPVEEEDVVVGQPENPIAVHSCARCMAHLKQLVSTLGARAAQLPY